MKNYMNVENAKCFPVSGAFLRFNKRIWLWKQFKCLYHDFNLVFPQNSFAAITLIRTFKLTMKLGAKLRKLFDFFLPRKVCLLITFMNSTKTMLVCLKFVYAAYEFKHLWNKHYVCTAFYVRTHVLFSQVNQTIILLVSCLKFLIQFIAIWSKDSLLKWNVRVNDSIKSFKKRK